MKFYLDRKINQLWYAKPGLVAWLLWPFSGLYRFFCFMHRLLFRCGFIPVYQPSIPVVVIGNLTVGGVGKTPVVSALAQYFMKQGKTVGIVSRGYGGQSKTWPRQVTAESDPRLVGDEPVMLASQLGCHVVVAPKRVDAIRVCEDLGCNIIFSDDGLTHYYFKRALECIVVDASRVFGNGFCLPAGPLRTPKSYINSDHMILMNTESDCNESSWYVQPQAFVNVWEKGIASPIDKFKGQKVHAVSAIGNNVRFFKTLRALGCEIIEHSFPDHYSLSDKDIAFSDSYPIVMTEKDAVKCRDIKANKAVWYLRVNANLDPSVYEKIEKQFN